MIQGEQIPIKDGELIAAIDMGSNSFHMVVARVEHGEPRVIDRLRDTVRMAAGLRADGTLDAEHRARVEQRERHDHGAGRQQFLHDRATCVPAAAMRASISAIA